MCDIKYYVITYIHLIGVFYWWLTNNVAALLGSDNMQLHLAASVGHVEKPGTQHSFGHFSTGIPVVKPRPRVTLTHQEVTYVYLRGHYWACKKFYFSFATVLLKLKVKVLLDITPCNLVGRSPCSRETYVLFYTESHFKKCNLKSVLLCKDLKVNLSNCRKNKDFLMIHNLSLSI